MPPPTPNQAPGQERGIIPGRKEPISSPLPTGVPFKPTLQQEAYLLYRLTPITRSVPSRERLARRLNIPPAEIDEWHENKDFSDWFNGKVNLYLAEELIVIHGALFKKAKGGNVPAMELYLKRNDKVYQSFLGKIDLAVRSVASPVSPEEMARAVVKEVKTNPEFRKLLEHELSNEGEIIDVDQLHRIVCPSDSQNNDGIV
ncbi:MAG: phBC6A51 family helix-turn-helix protein [Candidatus Brocadiaceae bacterium]|nr:phBC6A51 family helix-turn-helix protein [Candidatus Brocadiaceae bacterium]